MGPLSNGYCLWRGVDEYGATFWALPALAIAGLGARDIMGYCIVALFFH